ncbi:hypothetical protein [Micropruina sonneratiae]|uniref:hypothetical protein n=1 Tax=Micropruina sonneratiae TaxID=2986940 RepID=UPI002227C4B3|nr:hypothetical protein [Micropruina sp. KQZ13P-5]MCW3156487.1 hypothetical protein [Micropruina sp. KQZ13P-5]
MSGGDVLRFDLAVDGAVANLTGQATGIHRLVGRPPTESTATVVDTADHRLLDWGIELSRTVETGQWVLLAPGWEPVLPAELRTDAEDELPTRLADLLVPFRRGGILGPKLKVVTSHRRYTLTDAAGGTFGELTDQRVRVSHHGGGLCAFRNVTMRTSAPLTAPQRQAVQAAFAAAGARQVEAFDSIAGRLGLAHHSRRRSRLSARAPIEDFVSAQLESRWRGLLADDLAARTSADDPVARRDHQAALRRHLETLRQELDGLETLLEPSWVRYGERLIDAALADTERPLQHTERWLRILDVLAQGSTTPPLPYVKGRITGPVLAQELEAVVQTLRDQCRTLEAYTDDERWARAHVVAGRASALSALARDVFGKPAKQLRKQLDGVTAALAPTVRANAGEMTDLHELTPAEVFEAGRAYERAMLRVDYAREAFVRDWPQLWEGLRTRVIRPRVPHQAGDATGPSQLGEQS